MIDTLIAKLGLFAASPFLMFGGNANLQADVTHKAQAQEGTPIETVCTDLEHNLYFGLRDRGTDGEVTELQKFLKAEGHLTKKAPNGFYGMATYRAVRDFQGDHDLRRTGAVNQSTRDAIKDISCDGEEPNADLEITSINAPASLMINEEGEWTVNVESTTEGNLSYSVVWGDENMWSRMLHDDRTQSSATFTHSYSEAGTYTPKFTVTDDEGNTVTEAAVTVTVSDEDEDDVSITALSSTSGYAGDEVTITGTGFSSDTVVYVGSTKITDVAVDSETKVRFDIPSLGKGSYDVYVENANGTSNSIRFELKEKSVRLSINGIDAPSRLMVGQEGTWTVNADTNVEGNLQYSVVWGDEGMATMFRSSADASWSTSSEFTHTYDKPGTYKPTFTVSDGNGKTSKVSATVVVTK